MPKPANSTFNRFGGIPGTRGADPSKELKQITPKISESVLSVTLGERLRRREGPMRNVRGDRPEPQFSDD